MKSHEIRDSFLKFFEQRDHRVVASAPVVPQGDPTLLFTNAGMNQFKDVLLGNEERDYKRATSVQKCIRAGGKHNDLDEVGKDGRHLTFFEMLGNWSFGDYYKRDAIKWSWEYVLESLGLPEDRLYVTIYKDDDDSFAIWHEEVGVPADRILRLGDIEKGDEENFWSMGPTGPCGPCTEIHFDLHPEKGELTFAPGYDDDRVVEIWNLVFMEFNRDETGELNPLPMQSVDTGMGLDRVAAIIEGTDSVFKTDLFRPIHQKTASLLGETIEDWSAFYAREDFSDFCVIADHIRAVTFSLCDGAQFSNEGRGYVLRRILRRAVRHGRNLGFRDPFLHTIAQAVVGEFGEVYPELRAMGSKAAELIRLEEERFFRNIERGIELFEEAAQRASAEGRDQLTGEEVFELHATYGFPPDLTRIMAQERGLDTDEHGYERLWREHQEASRGKDLYADAAGVGDWLTVHEGESSKFVGYSRDETTTRIMKYRHIEDERYELILEQTPFYAESGGQVGDTGVVVSDDNTIEFRVTDTQKAPIGVVHSAMLTHGAVVDGTLAQSFRAKIDIERRRWTESNHTATHLLHAALRHEVSDAIFQSGSLVSPEKLRFDFSHSRPLTDDEVRAIEERVNQAIRSGVDVVVHEDVERERAVEQMGAMAIFGEKYGDVVRVIEIDGAQSVELCGGTHVRNTRDINLFRITGESGVAAGIRRIEAVTNEMAYQSFQQDRAVLEQLASLLKTDERQVVDRARALLEERAELDRQVKQLSQRLAKADSGQLVEEAEDVDGVQVIAKKIAAQSRDQMLEYADMLRDRLDEGVVLLAAEIDEKPALLCLVTDAAFKNRKLKAGDLVNAAASYVEGRGGGRPTLAQAGGTKVEGLSASVDNFSRIVREHL